MKVQVKVAVKVQIHFSHPEKLVPRPRELSTSRNTLTSEKGRYAANKILYLFAQHYYQCTLIGTPGTGNKTQCFPFFFFFPVINSLREHPLFSALVSSLFFGLREATTGNTSAVRRLVQFKKLRMYRKENADLRHENIIVMAFLIFIKTNSGCLRLSLSVTSRFKIRVPSSPSKKN